MIRGAVAVYNVDQEPEKLNDAVKDLLERRSEHLTDKRKESLSHTNTISVCNFQNLQRTLVEPISFIAK